MQTVEEKLAICQSAAKIARSWGGWFWRQPAELLTNECMLHALSRQTISLAWATQRLKWFCRQQTVGTYGENRSISRRDAAEVRARLQQTRSETDQVIIRLTILDALSTLTWLERYVVVARFWLDEPYAKIASDLGYNNVGSVAWQLSTALQKLHYQLKGVQPW